MLTKKDDIRQQLDAGDIESAILAMLKVAQVAAEADVKEAIVALRHRLRALQREAEEQQRPPEALAGDRDALTAAARELLERLPDTVPEPPRKSAGIAEQTLKYHILLLTLGVKVWVLVWLFNHWESGGFSADQFAGTLTLLVPVLAAYTGLMFQDFLEHRHAHAEAAPESPRVHRKVQWTIYAVIIAYGLALTLAIDAKVRGQLSYAQLSGALAFIESALGIYIARIVRTFFQESKSKSL